MRITPETPLESLPAYLTVDEFSTYVHLRRWTVYRLIQDGKVPSLRVGNSLRIPKQALADLATENGHAARS